MIAAIGLLAFSAGLGMVAPAIAVQGQGDQVTICHATGSESHPYNAIDVDSAAWSAGTSTHSGHSGDFLAGTNNTDMNCNVITPSPTPTPTPTVTPTPTPTPTVTPTPTPTPTEGQKITICHATGSETNPYNAVEVNLDAWNEHTSAHSDHESDVVAGTNGLDADCAVIPPAMTSICLVSATDPLAYTLTSVRESTLPDYTLGGLVIGNGYVVPGTGGTDTSCVYTAPTPTPTPTPSPTGGGGGGGGGGTTTTTTTPVPVTATPLPATVEEPVVVTAPPAAGTVEEPVTVTVPPQKATVPMAAHAGGGSSAPRSESTLLGAVLMVLGAAAMAGGGLRLATARKES